MRRSRSRSRRRRGKMKVGGEMGRGAGVSLGGIRLAGIIGEREMAGRGRGRGGGKGARMRQRVR
jgi:hypothetical protein